MIETINERLGISNERAKELTKQLAEALREPYQNRMLTESVSIKKVMELNGLTDLERCWLAYHIGGVNRFHVLLKGGE